ncbi:MAG: hypothetical protein ACM30I_11060 [Gemmatimonas sp.]
MIDLETYIINLPHRKDRLEETLRELDGLGINPELIHAIPARLTPRNGAIGCAMSHAFALSSFLFSSDSHACLVVEDDFECKAPDVFRDKIPGILRHHDNWDVVLLAWNGGVGIEQQVFEGIWKVQGTQTASAYVVNRKYAPSLIRLFYQAGEMAASHVFKLHRGFQQSFYAIDMLWKNEQLFNRFLAFNPAVARQRASYSDIENAVKDYGV